MGVISKSQCGQQAWGGAKYKFLGCTVPLGTTSEYAYVCVPAFTRNDSAVRKLWWPICPSLLWNKSMRYASACITYVWCETPCIRSQRSTPWIALIRLRSYRRREVYVVRYQKVNRTTQVNFQVYIFGHRGHLMATLILILHPSKFVWHPSKAHPSILKFTQIYIFTQTIIKQTSCSVIHSLSWHQGQPCCPYNILGESI